MQNAQGGAIPHYYLYGDQGADVDLDLLHIEPIRDRSGPNDWRIRPHAHPDHMQVLLVSAGGGVIRMEDRALPISAPALLCIPAGIVHQIDFQAGTDGYVVTAALDCLKAAAAGDARLTLTAGKGAVYPVEGDGPDLDAVQALCAELHREFIWSAPGRRIVLVALFTRLLVVLLRLAIIGGEQASSTPDRDYDLLMRYRALLEAHFRSHRPLSAYAGDLAVTPARLNAACKARSGRTASDLLYDRLLTEAKRYLIYSESSVAQVAHLTGFEDPAYFNRFFTRRMGQTPGAFRKAARPEG